MATGRLVSWASGGALAVWLLAGCGGSVVQAPKPAIAQVAKPAAITDIQVSGTGDAVEILVITSAKAAYSLVRQSTPPRLFLELTATGLDGQEILIPVNRGVVSVVKASTSGSNANVEVFLTDAASYDIGGRVDGLVLNVLPKAPAVAAAPAEISELMQQEQVAAAAAAAAVPSMSPVITTIVVEEPVAVAAAPEVAAPQAEIRPGPSALTAIDVEKQDDGLVVTLQGDGPLKHEYFLVEGRSLVIDIYGASNKVKRNKMKVGDPWVSQIRLGEHEQPKKFVRVVFDLKKVGEYSVNRFDDRIVVAFGAPALAATGAVSVDPVAATEIPVPIPVRVAVTAPDTVPAPTPAPTPAPMRDAVSNPVPAPAAPAAIPPADPAAAPAAKIFSAQEYTGRRLSLDFKDAEVSDILRLISEVSGLNFVAGPEVKGVVSIKLTNVPWDQALELILKTNVPQLAQVRESENIIRITTSDKIMDEEQRRRRGEEDKKKTIDAQQALEPLITKSYSLSYAETMSAVATQLGKFLSPQGKVEADERTKTIIVKDTARAIGEIDEVVIYLDAPTPAVMVEARIVQMDTNSGRDLGVQWGGNFNRDPAHGNATKYAFPNSVGVAGTEGGVNNGLVNLPAISSTSGIGISFGHIANTIGLDLRLSAMESMRKSKTLSSPKVLVLHNKEAKIHVGLDMPVPSTDAQGVSKIDFKPIGITLIVTPRVTNDKRIVMKIDVSNDQLGSPLQVQGSTVWSVDKKTAVTEVIVKDGETTVIGGMYEEATRDSEGSVPGLSKIPILGYLFKSSSKSIGRTELLIFITPKIIVM